MRRLGLPRLYLGSRDNGILASKNSRSKSAPTPRGGGLPLLNLLAVPSRGWARSQTIPLSHLRIIRINLPNALPSQPLINLIQVISDIGFLSLRNCPSVWLTSTFWTCPVSLPASPCASCLLLLPCPRSDACPVWYGGRVKPWKFCNFLQVRSPLYRFISITSATCRSSGRCSSSSRMSPGSVCPSPIP